MGCVYIVTARCYIHSAPCMCQYIVYLQIETVVCSKPTSFAIYIYISGRTSFCKCSKCFYVYLNIRPMRYFFLCMQILENATALGERRQVLHGQFCIAEIH